MKKERHNVLEKKRKSYIFSKGLSYFAEKTFDFAKHKKLGINYKVGNTKERRNFCKQEKHIL